jgi:hypothetical protein
MPDTPGTPDDTLFTELSEADFPFVVEFIRTDTQEVVHSIRVDGPGAVRVPPLGKELGVEIDVRIVDG